MSRRSSSPFIHERDAANEDDVSQTNEVNLIASQMEWDGEFDEADGEEPQIGEGAWVNNVWFDPIDPHSVPPRYRTNPDPDYVPEVMLNIYGAHR